MGPAASDGISRVPPYSGYCYALSCFAYWPVTIYGAAFQPLLLAIQVQRRSPTTPALRCHNAGLGCSPFARHYLGNHVLFSLPAGTKMFQFPALASPLGGDTHLWVRGLSHSGIHGSTVICTSPWLFAAYRALRRLREPRHPPCALVYFLRRYS